ncbi:MAG: chorismate mutase [Actinomycetota bacterium]
MQVRAARGAIVVAEDRKDLVHAASARLVQELLGRNGLQVPDLVSIFFTATPDLVSGFPAEGARTLPGIGAVPLLCAREIDVAGAMARVIRVLIHFHDERPQSEIAHAYLDGAEALRDDL